MSEEVSSRRNGTALETHGSGPAAQAAQAPQAAAHSATHTATHAAARGVRRIRSIEVACEVRA
ncbi:hypothetical protein [Paraburkholderia sp. JPY465]|uniref:hypothetical protein n=1 Tax=Paraburkholderia sp. JPY465 TaxID=3042285 RepID=UPI003D1EDBB7